MPRRTRRNTTELAKKGRDEKAGTGAQKRQTKPVEAR
jgi:hypothetical protein